MECKVYSGVVPPDLVNQLAEIYMECFTGPPRFEKWTLESSIEEMRRFIDAGADVITLKNESDIVVSCAIGLPLRDFYNGPELVSQGADPDSYYFAMICTRIVFRNQGFGGSLHAKREEQARKRGYKIETVRCRADNAVNLRLLGKAGFEEIARYESAIAGSVSERLILAKDLG